MTNPTNSSCAETPAQIASGGDIAMLRQLRGETLDEFARRIGIQSKGQMSLIERGLRTPTPEQALAIEELSGGQIDASALNPIIAKARGVDVGGVHGVADSAISEAVSPGNPGDDFPEAAE